MCDFHSVCIRVDGALAHVKDNSHSGAVKAAGWVENQPHKRPVFVEAEWDGDGEYPGADKICRIQEGEKLTAKQRETCDRHYKALADVLNSPEPKAASLARFKAPEFSDVKSARLRRLPGMVETIGWLAKRIDESGHDELFADMFLSAWIPGKDYSMVWPKFALWLMTDEKHGVLRLSKTKRTKDAITGVAELYAEWIKSGSKPDVERWRKARSAATAVATTATTAAAVAAVAAYASAATTATTAAAAAVYAAAYARKIQWIAMGKKLIELITQ